MRKSEKLDDIRNRHSLAIAERDAFCVKGSENYKTLSKCANLIIGEYEHIKKSPKYVRHGFRLENGKYRIVFLNDNEKI